MTAPPSQVGMPLSTHPIAAPKSTRGVVAAQQKPVLQIRNLCKDFPVGGGWKRKRLRALNDVSFDLHRGEVIALVGESGSGKSTLLRILARLEASTSGRIIFDGADLLAIEPRAASLSYRSRVQMIFQDPFGSLNPVHNASYHLERPLRRHGRAATRDEVRARVCDLLATVGLTPPEDFAQKLPHQMSGGQRQRVAIARALAVDPEVILADEPISMLDVSIRMGVLNLMSDLKTEHGIGYLYVTHDIASAHYIADRMMVMYAGHIVEGAASHELLTAPQHPYTRLLLAAIPNPRTSLSQELPAGSGQPTLVDPPPGCPFADRCPEVMGVCRRENPALVPLRGKDSDPHLVRCHLAT